MARLSAQYSVQIRILLKDGKTKFGSGYGIGPHWILTARHVLFGEGVGPDASVLLSRGGKDEVVPHANVLWHNEELDIALIRCDALVADAPHAHQVLNEEPPEPEARWSGYGYSGVLPGEAQGRRDLSPVGVVGHYRPETKRATFTSTSVDLECDDYWKGFSGSPLFVNDRLSAVAIKVNKGEKNALLGTFVSDAFVAPGGAEGKPLAEWLCVGDYSSRRATEKRLEPEIVDRLCRHPTVLKRLNEVFQKFIEPRWASDTAPKLFDAYRTAPDDRVASCFVKLVKEFVSSGDRESVRMIDFLARSWLLFVSSVRAPIWAIAAVDDMSVGKSITVKVVAPEVVDLEAYLAFVEGREPLLEIRSGKLRAPLNLTPHHPTGVSEDGSQEREDLFGTLSLHAIQGGGAFVDAVEKRFEVELTHPDRGISRDSWARMERRERFGHIQQRLLEMYMENNGIVYAVVSNLNDPLLDELRKHCPQFLLIEAIPDDDGQRGPIMSSLNTVIYMANSFLGENEGTSE